MRGRDRVSHVECALLVAATWVLCAASAHAEDSKLRILGAQGATGTVTRVSTTAAVEHTLVIQSLVTEPLTFAVDVGPLVDPKGVSKDTSAKLDGAAGRTATIAPLGIVPLSITATLPMQAEYTAEITLSYGGARQLARLVVVRSIEPLPVTVLAVEPVHAIAATTGASTATLDITLEETSGAAIALETPVLSSFAVKTGETRHQAHPKLALGADAPRDPKTGQLVLASNQTLRVPIVLSELEGAGEYTGTIRIGAPGKKSVDQPFTLMLRESRWTAFGFLFLGCVIAMALQWATVMFRPRLVVERRLAVVARQLEQWMNGASGDDQERAMLVELSQIVQEQRAKLRSESVANSEAAVAIHEDRTKLAGEWLSGYRQLNGIELPEARGAVTSALEAARVEITSAGATVETLKPHHQKLEQLATTARDEVKKALEVRLEAMRKSIETASRGPLRTIGLAVAEQVLPLLEESSELLKKFSLGASLQVYKKARKLWLVLLLDDLDAALATSTSAPAGFTSTDWQAMVGTIAPDVAVARRLLVDDPDAALRQYRSAQARYLAALAIGLGHAINEAREELTRDDKAIQSTLTDALTEGEKAAAEARLAAATGKLDEASLALERASSSLQKVKPTEKKLGAAGPAAPGSVVVVRDGVTDLRASAPRLRRVWRVSPSRLIWLIDVAATVLALGLATLVGLSVLWEPNLTWGGPWAYTTAVLWGLGLHGATFASVTSVVDKLPGRRLESRS